MTLQDISFTPSFFSNSSLNFAEIPSALASHKNFSNSPKINTYKSASKQTTSTTFRINTYEKHRGGWLLWITRRTKKGVYPVYPEHLGERPSGAEGSVFWPVKADRPRCFVDGQFLHTRCRTAFSLPHYFLTSLLPPFPHPLELTALESLAYSAEQGIPRRFFCALPPFAAEDRFFFMAKGNFGERLKRERELREVSLDELIKATRISPRFMDALENEEWGKLPGGVFGRGFVRTIARYLGLDEESLLAEYDLARGEQKTEGSTPYESQIPRPPKWIPVAAVLVIVLLLAGIFYAGRYAWRHYAAHRAKQQSSANSVATQPAAASTIPNVTRVSESSVSSTSSTSSTSLTSTPLDLSVSTSAATRVRISADNALLLDAEIPAGETRHFSATQQFEVTAADSSAVLLELNGQAMPPLGTPGSSGTIVLSQRDLRQASGGNSQP